VNGRLKSIVLNCKLDDGNHQDIRRLMALAYQKLTAEAREEIAIACDHFTNALSNPDFALKVKEKAPTSGDLQKRKNANFSTL